MNFILTKFSKKDLLLFVFWALFWFFCSFLIYLSFPNKTESSLQNISKSSYDHEELRSSCSKLKKWMSLDDFFKIFPKKRADSFSSVSEDYSYNSKDMKWFCRVTFIDWKIYSFVWLDNT